MIRSPRTLAPVLLIAVSLISLAGCSGADRKLDGTGWKLDVWTLSSVSPREFPITAEFTGGHISGSCGVNTYSGPYRVGPGGAFSVGPIAATQRAGSDAAMHAETAYLTLLRLARSFRVTDSRLTLFDEFGNESINFEAANSQESPDARP